MGHARAIINVENADQQLYILKERLPKNFLFESGRPGALSRNGKIGIKTRAGVITEPSDKEISQLQSKLSSHFWHSCCCKERWKKR
jgi:ParB family chromosome partitioning protein